jgi:hypothetical protein
VHEGYIPLQNAMDDELMKGLVELEPLEEVTDLSSGK